MWLFVVAEAVEATEFDVDAVTDVSVGATYVELDVDDVTAGHCPTGSNFDGLVPFWVTRYSAIKEKKKTVADRRSCSQRCWSCAILSIW